MSERRFTPPPKPEKPDAYLDMHSLNYHRSFNNSNDNSHHGHLRRFFHLTANEFFPERHKVYSSKESLDATPLKSRGDIGETALISAMFHRMLEDHDLMFDNTGSRKTINRNITNSLWNLFNGKTVFLIPGRSGQTASFIRKFGANVGLTTDDRYIPPVLSVLNSGRLGNDFDHLHSTKRIAFLINARFEEAAKLLKTMRVERRKPDHDGIIYADLKKTESDIIICTNIFNKERFEAASGESRVNGDKRRLLLNLVSIGVPNKTKVYLVPATEHGHALTKTEIEETLSEYADLRFYNPETSGGSSVLPTLADFTLSITLKKEIPEYLL